MRKFSPILLSVTVLLIVSLACGLPSIPVTGPNVNTLDANAVGTATITATISGKSATAQVTVAAAATTITVNMPGTSFTPFRATLKRGGTVNYVFPSLAHNVIFEKVAGVPADIPGQVSNQTISRQFQTVSLFKYSCSLHNGMDGEIDVVP